MLDPIKIEVVHHFDRPTSMMEIRSLVRLAG